MPQSLLDQYSARGYVGILIKFETITRGAYVCELLEVLSFRIWRVKVRVVSILRLPNQLAFTKSPRYSKAINYREIIECNGSSIVPYNDAVLSYMDSLIDCLSTEITYYAELCRNKCDSNFAKQNIQILSFLNACNKEIVESKSVS